MDEKKNTNKSKKQKTTTQTTTTTTPTATTTTTTTATTPSRVPTARRSIPKPKTGQSPTPTKTPTATTTTTTTTPTTTTTTSGIRSQPSASKAEKRPSNTILSPTHGPSVSKMPFSRIPLSVRKNPKRRNSVRSYFDDSPSTSLAAIEAQQLQAAIRESERTFLEHQARIAAELAASQNITLLDTPSTAPSTTPAVTEQQQPTSQIPEEINPTATESDFDRITLPPMTEPQDLTRSYHEYAIDPFNIGSAYSYSTAPSGNYRDFTLEDLDFNFDFDPPTPGHHITVSTTAEGDDSSDRPPTPGRNIVESTTGHGENIDEEMAIDLFSSVSLDDEFADKDGERERNIKDQPLPKMVTTPATPALPNYLRVLMEDDEPIATTTSTFAPRPLTAASEQTSALGLTTARRPAAATTMSSSIPMETGPISDAEMASVREEAALRAAIAESLADGPSTSSAAAEAKKRSDAALAVLRLVSKAKSIVKAAAAEKPLDLTVSGSGTETATVASAAAAAAAATSATTSSSEAESPEGPKAPSTPDSQQEPEAVQNSQLRGASVALLNSALTRARDSVSVADILRGETAPTYDIAIKTIESAAVTAELVAIIEGRESLAAKKSEAVALTTAMALQMEIEEEEKETAATKGPKPTGSGYRPETVDVIDRYAETYLNDIENFFPSTSTNRSINTRKFDSICSQTIEMHDNFASLHERIRAMTNESNSLAASLSIIELIRREQEIQFAAWQAIKSGHLRKRRAPPINTTQDQPKRPTNAALSLDGPSGIDPACPPTPFSFTYSSHSNSPELLISKSTSTTNSDSATTTDSMYTSNGDSAINLESPPYDPKTPEEGSHNDSDSPPSPKYTSFSRVHPFDSSESDKDS